MKRVVICMAATVFLLISWTVIVFSEPEKSIEDELREEGLITEQEYNAVKKFRGYSQAEQSLQTQEPESPYDNQRRQKKLAKEEAQRKDQEEKAKVAEEKRLAKEGKAKAAEEKKIAREETARKEQEKKAEKVEQKRLAKEEVQRKKQEKKAKE
ncbi:MAG: hypothetical protein V1923_05120 [Candidatus Omnitrophota bacterium]